MTLETPDQRNAAFDLFRRLKHWDAYSLENSDGYTRHNFNAIVDNQTLADTWVSCGLWVHVYPIAAYKRYRFEIIFTCSNVQICPRSCTVLLEDTSRVHKKVPHPTITRKYLPETPFAFAITKLSG